MTVLALTGSKKKAVTLAPGAIPMTFSAGTTRMTLGAVVSGGEAAPLVKVRPWLSTNLSRQWEVLLGFRPVQLLKMASAS